MALGTDRGGNLTPPARSRRPARGPRLILVALLLVATLAAACGTALEPGWKLHRDPLGYSLRCPNEWTVAPGPRGGAVLGPPERDAEALLWGALLKPGFALDEGGLRTVLGAALGRHEVVSARKLKDQSAWIAAITVSRESGDWRGVYLCVADGLNLVVAGLAAAPAAYAARLPVLLKIVSSFEFAASAADLAALTGVSEFETYKDPHEGAFTLLVPKGWQVSGGLDRPYIDAGVRLEITDGQTYLFFGSPYPPLFATPTFILAQLGFGEGARYNPWGRFANPYGQAWDMIVSRYRDAAAYVREVFAPGLAGLSPGAQLTGVESRPDLAETMPRQPMVTACTAAAAEFVGPAGLVHGCTVVDQLMSAGGLGLWGVSVSYWRAPAACADQARFLVSLLERSFRVDPAWAAREAQEVNRRLGIVSRTGAEMAEIVNTVYRYRTAVEDRAARRFSEAILGLEYVYEPGTGQAWQVPNYSGYYWRRGSEIYRTAGPNPPVPDPDFVELYRGG